MVKERDIALGVMSKIYARLEVKVGAGEKD